MELEFKKAVNLYENNKINEAKKICLKFYIKNPNHFDNLRLLNFIHFKNKDFSTALDFINKAIKLNPNFAEAYNEQGNALNELKKLEEAIKSYDNAIKINPKYADAYYNKGLVLHELKKLESAVENYDKAIKIDPKHIMSHNNKGFALQQLKKVDASLKSYNEAYKINPNFNFLFGKLIHTKNKLCNWETFNKEINSLKEKLNTNKIASLPFSILSLYDSPLLQKKTSEMYIKETFPKKNILKPITKNLKNKKIRLGYYSGDFYNHAMSYLLAKLFELHDKSKFEIIAFSFSPERNDEMSKRISNAFDQFIKVNFKTDKEIAELSRELKIDIAIDLMCFTTNSRTGIFSEKCAPIQINYLGYPGTSGASFIDYIIADKTLIPKENQKYYSEKIIYLPNTYQVRDSTQKISNKIFTKDELNLPKNSFVFCCFNQNYKITPSVFDIWMRLLKKVEKSVLWLIKDNDVAAYNLKKEAEKRGIRSDRIIFAEHIPISEHLARHKVADLFVDTFPYTAHTTCSDALWSGLPVITRMGQSFASRVAGSLLNAINLKELITKTEKEYENLILKLSKNPKKIKEIKNKLKKNRLKKPLFNSKLYTKKIEYAYKKIYERYKSDLPLKNIEIK
mgnify:CR=1 FL=1